MPFKSINIQDSHVYQKHVELFDLACNFFDLLYHSVKIKNENKNKNINRDFFPLWYSYTFTKLSGFLNLKSRSTFSCDILKHGDFFKF